MKKIGFLTGMFFALFALSIAVKAQNGVNAVNTIENLQNKSNLWINNGQIDSVMTLYRADATVFPTYSNLTEIRKMIKTAIDGGYKLIDFNTLSISVADSIAVQKYEVVFKFMGITYKQKGMTEWRLANGKWLILNDIFVNY